MSRARFYLAGFGALALIDTWTQVSFKLAARQTGEFEATWAFGRAALHDPWLYAAAAGYIASFFAWLKLIERAPIGSAFAVSHVEIVLILIVAVAFFGEHLDTRTVLGAIAIMAGVAVLSYAERNAGPAATEASG